MAFKAMTGNLLRQFRETNQRLQESLFPATVQLGETLIPFPAATGGVHRERQLDPDGGGVIEILTAVFSIRKTLLGTAPVSGTRVFWLERSSEFRLARVGDGGDTDPAWQLTCEAVTA